ncbi:MAG: DUF935 family protein [Porphyromonas sp.]|nr:DUF935 family protein [Porphyromonas sp.]
MGKHRKEAKTLAPTQTTPSVLVHQITVKQPNRKIWDVGTWRSALKSADTGRVTALYDLYEDILIDTVLADAIDKRIRAVGNTTLTFVDKDGVEVKEVTTLMDSLDWEDIITQIMLARFWGRSAIELGFGDHAITCAPIPSKHINLRNKTILINQSDEIGIPYENDPFLLVLGKERDYGLLLKTAPYIIYKRGGFGDWAQWIELFGMPQRVGKYNIHDPESKRVLEQALEAAGSASYLLAPDGTQIEHVETNTGSGSAYNDFRRACNEEVLIAILGQTMTTVQGDKGARSLGEVHLEVEECKHQSDLRYVQRVLNQYLIPRLAARGYPVDGGRFIYPEATEHLDVSEIVQLSDIIEIPSNWIHVKYAIPIPKDGESIARRTFTVCDPGEEETQNTSNKDVLRNSDGFVARLKRFFGFAPRMNLGAYQTSLHTENNITKIALADVTTFDDALIERIALAAGKTTFDTNLFSYLSNDLLTALKRAYKHHIRNADVDISLQYQLQDDAYITAMEANLFRFSAGKTLSEVYELNKAFRESHNYSDFAQRAKDITSTYNDKWQRTEYNTALNCALAASNYRELKRKSKLFPYWEYKTVGDSKVRPEHTDLDGLILPYNSPKWDEIYPPNGWNCRCSVAPRMKHEVEGRVNLGEMYSRVEKYQTSPEWQSAKAQGWGVNRSETAEIFDANQQYIYKLPTHAGRSIDDLHAQHYGLYPVSKLMKRSTTSAPETHKHEQDIWNEVAGQSETLVLSDYRGRKIVLDHKSFLAHTEKKNDNRIVLWDAMLEALTDPSEVWIHRERGKDVNKLYKKRRTGKAPKGIDKLITQDDIAILKYYQDKVIVVNVKIEQDRLVLKTWYELRLKKNTIDDKRRGLLIHNKKG